MKTIENERRITPPSTQATHMIHRDLPLIIDFVRLSPSQSSESVGVPVDIFSVLVRGHINHNTISLVGVHRWCGRAVGIWIVQRSLNSSCVGR